MESQDTSNAPREGGAQSLELSCSLDELAMTAERLLESARQFDLND